MIVPSRSALFSGAFRDSDLPGQRFRDSEAIGGTRRQAAEVRRGLPRAQRRRPGAHEQARRTLRSEREGRYGSSVDNPFERYDIDPREGIAAITARLRELVEDASDEAERERVRSVWEELTLHPARRLKAALFAHPETRRPLGLPPQLPRPRAGKPAILELGDLAARPSLVVALWQGDLCASDELDLPPSLDDDPCL